MKLQSPFYYDKNPSFSLYYHSINNKVLYKDFKHNWCGDCFNFVMKLFKISYKESVYKIAKDLNLLHLYDAGILEEIGDYSVYLDLKQQKIKKADEKETKLDDDNLFTF